MKPAPFDYADPRSVEETVTHLARLGDDAKILAGGQSLVPMLNFRLARPSVLVDINRVAGLDLLRASGGTLRLGALVRQRRLERWAMEAVPLLAAALRLVGHDAIRTRGTVAGSLAHGDPAAELPAVLLALDGAVLARSARGERVVPAVDLWTGPLATSLAADEVLIESHWPLPGADEGWGLHEIARRHGDFALAGVVALARVRSGRLAAVRIAIFGACATPRRLLAIERALVGTAPTATALADAAGEGVARLDTVTDLHAPADYRRSVTRTLLTRALADAVARAKDMAP